MERQEFASIPVINLNVALWQEDSDPTSVTDDEGVAWMVGWYEGKRYKRPMFGFAATPA